MKMILMALPKFPLFALFIKKPLVMVLAAIPTVAVVPVVDIKSAAWILFYFFIFDFATGLYGSYCLWDKNPDKKDKWFFGNGEGFSSDKFKKMFIKGIIYMAFPVALNKFQHVFMIKNMKYESVSDAEFTLATICVILFIANEGFSIVHENLPKCGFNLYDRIRKIAKVKQQIKKDFQDE